MNFEKCRFVNRTPARCLLCTQEVMGHVYVILVWYSADTIWKLWLLKGAICNNYGIIEHKLHSEPNTERSAWSSKFASTHISICNIKIWLNNKKEKYYCDQLFIQVYLCNLKHLRDFLRLRSAEVGYDIKDAESDGMKLIYVVRGKLWWRVLLDTLTELRIP